MNIESSILISAISAIATIVSVVLQTKASNREIQHKLETQQAVLQTKLENLTNEVREHNNYAHRIPAIEEQIKAADHRLVSMEREINAYKRQISRPS